MWKIESNFTPANPRRDMLPPCRDCADKIPASSDHCRKPEYLEWKRLMDLKREDERKRSKSAMDAQIAGDQRFRKR